MNEEQIFEQPQVAVDGFTVSVEPIGSGGDVEHLSGLTGEPIEQITQYLSLSHRREFHGISFDAESHVVVEPA